MTTPYFTKKFVEPSLYRGYTVLKVHVQSKVRKKKVTLTATGCCHSLQEWSNILTVKQSFLCCFLLSLTS